MTDILYEYNYFQAKGSSASLSLGRVKGYVHFHHAAFKHPIINEVIPFIQQRASFSIEAANEQC